MGRFKTDIHTFDADNKIENFKQNKFEGGLSEKCAG